jgi:HlyD family secretion protein
MKTIAIVVVLIGLVAGGTLYYSKYVAAEANTTFRMAPVKRGDLLITIGATGTAEPQDVVDVGAQVQGIILRLGPDPRGETDPHYADKLVDYTTEVKEGGLLAQIDDRVYKANRDQAQAALDRAKADQDELEAKVVQAAAEWQRAQKLHEIKLPSMSGLSTRGNAATEPIKGISDSDYDLTKSNYEVAKANAAVGLTAIKQAEATLQLAEINMKYTTIVSPVNGTIIARRVNVGQTVVSSLNAPSLFLIGKDLSKMQVWVSVNEADVGRIKVGMPVQFSVASLPDEVFQGEVEKIRLNAASTQNVVVYTVEVNFDNSERKVMPYLTADPVKFVVDKRNDVLLVPNSALGFQPRPQDIVPAGEEESSTQTSSAHASPGEASVSSATSTKGESDKKDAAVNEKNEKDGSVHTGEKKTARHGKGQSTRGTIWVKDDELLRPIKVETGATDGNMTEISGPEVNEGMEVVVAEVHEDSNSGDTKNPFAPQFFRGGRKGQGGAGGGGGRGGQKGGRG